MLTVTVGTKSPPMVSVWYPALFTILLPLRRVSVLPTPILLILYAPVSPLAALTPPEACSCSLKKLRPCSTRLSISSSPSDTPRASMSSVLMTVTGKTSVIDAPLICDPTTTTSSTSGSDCAKSNVLKAKNIASNEYKYLIVSPYVKDYMYSIFLEYKKSNKTTIFCNLKAAAFLLKVDNSQTQDPVFLIILFLLVE